LNKTQAVTLDCYTCSNRNYVSRYSENLNTIHLWSSSCLNTFHRILKISPKLQFSN